MTIETLMLNFFGGYILLTLVIETLKSDSRLAKKNFICITESPLKMMKNGFYFILKALFVLNVFKFLS